MKGGWEIGGCWRDWGKPLTKSFPAFFLENINRLDRQDGNKKLILNFNEARLKETRNA